jgi:hypothetical protein
VALGLANLYLKRLAVKGSIKIVEFPRKPAAKKRLRYLLTPTGLAEKTRLTYEHITYSLDLYRRAPAGAPRQPEPAARAGAKRVALFGTGEAAEVAYLTLRGCGLEPSASSRGRRAGSSWAFPCRPSPSWRMPTPTP